MTGWQAVLLGIIQGLTEFLPVSSSGHLVLAEKVLGISENGISFEIFSHFGTLMAVITVFRRDLLQIVRGSLSHLSMKATSQGRGSEGMESDKAFRLLIYLVLATIPTAVIGLLFRRTLEAAFAHPEFVSVALLVTGLFLLSTRLVANSDRPLTAVRATLIGLAQVVAFFPGISRSGTTITAGMHTGISPMESARFSFLLAIPLILGVSTIQFLELVAQPPSADEIIVLGIGCATAYISGLLAIKLLMRVVQKGRFALFAYYCFAMGILSFGLFIW